MTRWLQIRSFFLVTFWQLNLYDIHIPKDRYEAELTRFGTLQREAAAASTLSSDDKDRFIASLVSLGGKLTDEMTQHGSARNLTHRRLMKEKNHWFTRKLLYSKARLNSKLTQCEILGCGSKDHRKELVEQIVQYCIIPRAKLSLADAAYAHQFVKKMHAMNTPGFHTLVFYDIVRYSGSSTHAVD